MTETTQRLRRAHPTPTPCQGGCGTILDRGFWCTGCRLRKCRGSVVSGATCSVPDCAIDHPRALRWHRFTDEHLIVCANHSALAGRRPLTWPAFLAETREHELRGWAKKSA